jgi:hypothetical protein
VATEILVFDFEFFTGDRLPYCIANSVLRNQFPPQSGRVLAFENPPSEIQLPQALLAVRITMFINNVFPTSVIFSGDSVKPQSRYRFCSKTKG